MRQKVRHRGRQRRTLDDWLTVLAPDLMRRIAAFFTPRLSPRSPIRRAIIARLSCSNYDAIGRGDFELLLARLDPEVEFLARGIMPPDMEEVYRGHEGVRRLFEGWVGQWEDYRLEVEEVIDTGGRREMTLVTVLRQSGRGKGSGVVIEAPRAQVVTVRDGLGVRVETFYDLDDAFAAAGISEAVS